MDRSKIPLDLIREKLAAEAERAKHRLEKARDILLGPLDTEIGATPYDVVYAEDRVRLKHYLPDTAPRLKTPLLLVHALFNRETILDLQPDRSVVRNFLKEGVEVYLVEWGDPGPVDRYLTLDDHISGYLNNLVDFIRQPPRPAPGQPDGGLHRGDLRRHVRRPLSREGPEPDHHGDPHQFRHG